MLLFPKEEHERIRNGELTVTFRDWDRIRVEAGKEYKSFNLGYVRVDEVGYVDFKKIPDEDVYAAGFASHEDFKQTFRKRNPGFNFGSGKLIRVKYTYLGSDQRTAAGVKPNEREMIRIMERLVELDVMLESELRSEELLEYLDTEKAKNTIAISRHFDISRDEVKKRMTLLKDEGLVLSRRDGYVLTIRGKTYLDSKI